MRRLKFVEVAIIRNAIKQEQGNVCALCGGSFTDAKLKGKKLVPKLTPTLDHNHTTGIIRGVLCSNCNGMEGRILNRVKSAKRDLEINEWLGKLLDYWNFHAIPQTPFIHPNHKTDDQKRIARNKKARRKRAANKAAKLLQDK